MFCLRITRVCLIFALSASVQAEVSMPSLFSDHMVLQREQNNPVWGTATPGESVTVSIHEQRHETVANDGGHWCVSLIPIPSGGPCSLS